MVALIKNPEAVYSTGPCCSLTGAEKTSAFLTVPLMYMTFVLVLEFDVIVIALLKLLGLPLVLYSTFTELD